MPSARRSCRRLSASRRRRQWTTTEALGAWGAYDRDDPFPLFAAVRELGAVHAVTLADGHDAWLVVGYDEARVALNDARLSKDMHAALATGGGVVAEGLPGPSFARHMLSVDPPDHTRLRRLVSAAFTPRRVEALRPRVQAIVDDLLDDDRRGRARRAGSTSSARSRSRCRSPSSASCSACPSRIGPTWGGGSPRCSSPPRPPRSTHEAKEASDAVVAMLEALVEAKQADPGDDLVSGLISARDGDERLSTQELLSTIFQLIVAGHDTTASLIGNSVVALLRAPGAARRAARRSRPSSPSPSRSSSATTRPSPTRRSATRSHRSSIGDVTIPAGAQVIICLAAANRDSGQYADPDALDIDRAESRHLAFGHGIHHCLGAPLGPHGGPARPRVAAAPLPRSSASPSPSTTLHWGHGDGLVLRGLSELPVIPGPSLPRT